MLIWNKIPHYQCGFCAVSEKWFFLVYGVVFRDFTKSTWMVFHIISTSFYWTEEKICDVSWHRRNSRKRGPRIECLWYVRICFLNSPLLSNSHSKFLTIWTIFFQFSITSNNSYLAVQFPYPSIFATCYPFPEIFTSFPFPSSRANSPFYPSVRSSSPTHFTSTFISNSADGLVYPSTLSGEVLCDTLRLIWRVCVRPSLWPPQWFPEIPWERISNCVLLFGSITYRSSSNLSVIRYLVQKLRQFEDWIDVHVTGYEDPGQTSV